MMDEAASILTDSEGWPQHKEDPNAGSSSGYNSTTVGRSDTLDDVAKTSEISLDEDDDDLFKSTVMQTGGPEGNTEEEEEDDEEPNPFDKPHLKLQSQIEEDPMVVGGRHGPTTPMEPTRLQHDNHDEMEHSEFLDIFVTSPHKVGEGMSSYMAYTIKTKTNMNQFRKKDNIVSRRFSDFLGLHDKLVEKYLMNGRIVPPAPDKSMFGMAKVKLGMENDSTNQDEFVEKRRASLERYLNRTAKHPSLRTDPDFRTFLEVESELPKANQTAALSGKNVMKIISRVGDRVSNLTLKMEETDSWFEEKIQLIDTLDAHFRKLWNSTEALVDHRKSLCISTDGTSKSLISLSSFEDNPGLSGAINKLGSVYDKIRGIRQDQCEADFYDLSELIKDYIGLVGTVKEAFGERLKAWQHWQSVSSALAKKREAKVRADLQMKPDRISQLRQDIAEYERQQEMAQENFEKVSRMIRKEVDFFDESMAEDFKTVIVKYLEKMLKAQDDIASLWERYLPDVQSLQV